MNDSQIRSALHGQVLQPYHDDPSCLVVDELGLSNGAVRVDVAVINGLLHGYEIKSPNDTLRRLSNQADMYSTVMDKMTLVVSENHYSKAASTIPKWWGILVCAAVSDGRIEFYEDRYSAPNRGINPEAVARLLWRSEVEAILNDVGFDAKILRQPRSVLYKELVQCCTFTTLRETVSQTLRARKDWRHH